MKPAAIIMESAIITSRRPCHVGNAGSCGPASGMKASDATGKRKGAAQNRR